MARSIKLTRGLSALVDDGDYEALAAFKWQAFPICVRGKLYGFYASRGSPSGTIYMHRAILAAAKGFSVDHANGNGLDNRRENLRIATQSQNMANGSPRERSSPYRGVHKHGRKWRAVIAQNEYAGSFDTPEDAARAYDRAAVARWGDFARPNFP